MITTFFDFLFVSLDPYFSLNLRVSTFLAPLLKMCMHYPPLFLLYSVSLTERWGGIGGKESFGGAYDEDVGEVPQGQTL